MQISEIFYSIQGETTEAGLPCIFIRTAGCGVHCRYCDTAYAWEGGQLMAIQDIIRQIGQWPCGLTMITGGEPLEQSGETVALCEALIRGKYRVLVETSGTRDISVLPAATTRIVDVKCPSSGVQNLIMWKNMEFLTFRDQVKFVISDRADYDWSQKTVREYSLTARCGQVLFSPVHGEMKPEMLARWILQDKLSVRLQIQIHKLLWPNMERGM